MLRPEVRASLFVALAGCVLLAGCDNSPSEAEVTTTPNPKPSAPKPAKLADQMVAAVSHGKSASVLGVHFSLGSTPTVNQDLPVEIALVPHEKFTSLSVHFDGPEGITVASGDSFGPKADVEPEKALTHQLMLRPTSEGVFMIGATVETEGSDGTVSRIYSIPVIVGPAVPAGSNPAPGAGTPPPAAPQAPAAN